MHCYVISADHVYHDKNGNSSDVSRYFEGFVYMLFLGEAASNLQQLRSHMAIVHLHASAVIPCMGTVWYKYTWT